MGTGDKARGQEARPGPLASSHPNTLASQACIGETCADWVWGSDMLLNPPEFPARQAHHSSMSEKQGTRSLLVIAIHLLSPLFHLLTPLQQSAGAFVSPPLEDSWVAGL